MIKKLSDALKSETFFGNITAATWSMYKIIPVSIAECSHITCLKYPGGWSCSKSNPSLKREISSAVLSVVRESKVIEVVKFKAVMSKCLWLFTVLKFGILTPQYVFDPVHHFDGQQ